MSRERKPYGMVARSHHKIVVVLSCAIFILLFLALPVFAAAPTIGTVDPASGPVAGSTNVTISGTNFPSSTVVDSFAKLFLKGEGAGSSFSDSSLVPKTITPSGSVTQTTAQKKLDNGSIYFNGAAGYLSTPDSADFDFGAGDFTIDTWFRPAALGIHQSLYRQADNYALDQGGSVILRVQADNTIQCILNDAAAFTNYVLVTTTDTVAANVWQHIACVRSGNNVYVFKDGVLKASGAYTRTVYNPTGDVRIGYHRDADQGYINGYIDGYRVTKGLARWTSAFTPPANPGVTFGGVSATNVQVASSTAITATAPAHTAGAVDVIVTNPDATSATLANGFSYTASSPTISSIAPTGGSNAGGTNIAIIGTNFSTGIDSNVKFLLHGDGAGVAFVDSETTPKTITTFGNATQSTAQSKFGGKSMYFDGSGDYVSTPDSEDFNFGSGDFTVDLWANFSDTTATVRSLLGQDQGGGTVPKWVLLRNYPAVNQLTFTNITSEYSWNWLPVVNTWYHIAIVRNGNALSAFVNGVKLASDKVITGVVWPNVAAPLVVGTDGESYAWMNGYIDEVRISKGIARWTANFTPPTNAYGQPNVTLGGISANNIVSVDSTSITATTPAHAAGVVDVTVTNPDAASATLTGGYTYTAAPGSFTLSPSSTPSSGGNSITVSGSNFVSGAIVTFGGVSATSVTFVNSTTLSVVTPVQNVGRYDVVVTNPDGQSATLAGGITFMDSPPSISSVAPSTGLISGGTNVTVTGTNFSVNNGFDSGVKLLLHGEGTAATFTDSETTPKAITAYGNVTQSATQSKFGAKAIFFDGSGDYLTVPSTSDFEFGTGSFTVDWWEYRTDGSANKTSILRDASTVYASFALGVNESGILKVYMTSNNSTWDVASSQSLGAVSLNQWVHLAVVRNGNTFYAFKNGTQTATWTASGSIAASAGPLSIGRWQNSIDFGGYLDEIRVSKGIARWTENFTPPTAPYSPASTVAFGGVPAANVSVTSPTSITATTPAHAAGTSDVVVTNGDSQSATAVNGFTFVTPPAPTVVSITPDSGSTVGGTNVTISGSNFYGDGSFRRSINIVNSNSSALTQYQVSFIVDTAALIAAGKMRSDGGDIRIIGTDGATALPYWVEPNSINTTATRIWTKVPSLVAGPSAIYLAYGGSNSVSQSLASSVFASEIPNAAALWSMDEPSGNILDSVGTYSVTGTPVSTTVAVGKFGNARAFNGSSSYISMGSTKLIGSGTAPFTYSTWFYPTRNLASGQWYMLTRLSQDTQFFLSIYNSGTTFTVTPVFRGATQMAIPIVQTDILNKWNHVVAVYNGGNKSSASSYSVYLNNVLLPAGSISQGTAGGACNDNALGSDADGSCVNNMGPFGGSMDTTAIFNRALTSTEIGSLYANAIYATSTYPGKVLVRLVSATEPTASVGVESSFAPLVSIGGTSATNVVLVNATTLTATTPAHTAGLVGVTVTNPDSQSATLSNGFTFIAPPAPGITSITPNSGLAATSTNVTITGSNFVAGALPTGGVVTTSGPYTVHTFTSSGTFNSNDIQNVETLVVGGGGAGTPGTGCCIGGGGGGAGGLIYKDSFAVASNTSISVTVGAGGAPGANGSNSVFGSLTAIGGGAGGAYNSLYAKSGGSAGGEVSLDYAGLTRPTATPGQGNLGGLTPNTASFGGGGGGAGGPGGAGTTVAPYGGLGGVGLQYSISGTPTYYAGGGGGSMRQNFGSYVAGASGGLGGGGTGSDTANANYTSGTPNTGGGGGAGYGSGGGAAGSGGSGVVIVRYLTSLVAPPAVTVGGVPAINVLVVNPTTITATVPAHATGTVDVIVANRDGQSATLVNGFAFVPPPAPGVISISPNSGLASGGTSAIITGTNFTDPTPSTASTKLLLRGEGSGTTFVDSSPTPQTLTSAGSATQTSTLQKFGNGSIQVTDTKQVSWQTSAGSTFLFPGDFTVDFWQYRTAANNTAGGSGFVLGNGTTYFAINTTAGAVDLYLNTATAAASVASAYSTDRWNHIALVRSGTGTNNLKLYVNGVQAYQTTNTAALGYASPTYARLGGGATGFEAYLDDVRVSTTALWTSNFTLAVAPAVTIGGTSALARFLSTTTLGVISPAHAGGAANVVVTNPDGQSGTLVEGFTYPLPTVSGVSPNFGPVIGGTPIVISGANFLDPTSVDPNVKLLLRGEGSGSTFVDSSPTPQTLTSAGSATQTSTLQKFGNGSIQVSDTKQVSWQTSAGSTFLFPGDFTIDFWQYRSPANNAVEGSSVIFGNGTTYFGINTVGGAANLYLNSSSAAASVSSAYTAGAWNHIALVRSGTGTNNLKLYVNGVQAYQTTNTTPLGYASPTYARLGGGGSGFEVFIDDLRITADTARWTSGFTPPAAPTVSIGGTQATGVRFVTTGSLAATTPAHAGGFADVVVTNSNGDVVTLSNGFSYAAPPTISSLTPGSVPRTGGDSVTISGNNFQASTTVSFGGVPATSVLFVNSNTLSVVTPVLNAGIYTVVATNPDGQFATLPNSIAFLNVPPTASEVTPTFGPASGGTAVTIKGANFLTGSFGSGGDGSITLTANKNITTDSIAVGRTCADAVNYSVTALAATSATISPAPAQGCLSSGDEILLINQQGTVANKGNVGNFETFRVQSVAGSVVTFTTSKTKFYGNGASDDTNIGTSTTNQRVMLQRVPNYQNVTINSGVTLTANAWDGTRGGILYFEANGTVTDNGTIDMSAHGYAGGVTGGNGPEVIGGYSAIGGGNGGKGADVYACPSDSSNRGGTGAGNAGGAAGPSRGTPGSDGAAGRGGGGAWCSFYNCGPGGNGGEGGGGGGSTSNYVGNNGGGGGAAYAPASNVLSSGSLLLGAGATQGAGGGGLGGANGPNCSTYAYGGGGGLANGMGGALGTGANSNGVVGGSSSGQQPGGGVININAFSIVTGAGSTVTADGGVGGVGGGGTWTGGGGQGGSGGQGGTVILSSSQLSLSNNSIYARGGVGGAGGSGHWAGGAGANFVNGSDLGGGGKGGGADVYSGGGGSGAGGRSGIGGLVIVRSLTTFTGTTIPAASFERLTAGVTVTFGSSTATVISGDSSSVTVLTPAHSFGTVDVTVTNSDGQAVVLPNSFTYIAPPTITAVSPAAVLKTGGATVTISGADFTATPAVTFGGIAAQSVTMVNSSTLSVMAPIHAVGIVDVVVTNPDGQAATSTNAITFTELPPTITSISPTSGPSGGGTSVTVTGSNFLTGSFGSGGDGAVTIASNKNINTDSIAVGRTCADAINYSVATLSANSATLSTTPVAGCLSIGDEVLLINEQGTATDNSNVGNYETFRIQSVNGAVITFANNKTKFYGNGLSDDTNIGTLSTNQRVMLQRIPNYTDFTLNTGITLTANPWDGTKGGVLYFKSNGTATVKGSIDMTGKGYRGGAWCGGTASGCTGFQGESYGGLGGRSMAANLGAGGGGYYNGLAAGVGYGGSGALGTSGIATGGEPSATLRGAPGGAYGDASNQKLFLGSGGGGGSYYNNTGGIGGGIVSMALFVPVMSGSVTVNGTAGGSGYAGNGSGGSVIIKGDILSLGSNLISATAPSAPAGGIGRIAAQYRSSVTGTTTPTAFTQGGLLGNQTVTFDGLAASNVVVLNDTTITAVTPSHGVGAVDVVVTNPDGQSVTLLQGFTYKPDRLVIVSGPLNLREGQPGTVVIQSQDASGNTGPVSVDTTIQLSSSASTGFFARDLTESLSTRWNYTSIVMPAGQSSATFYYMDNLKGTPTITLSASGIAQGTTQQETITSKYRFLVAGVSSPIKQGVPSSVTFQATDYDGTPLHDYAGTIHFTSTDGQAIMPPNYSITPAMLGGFTFVNGIAMMTQGTWCITITDVSDSNITGSQCSISVNPPDVGTPTQLKFITNPQFVPVTGTSTPITVQVLNTDNVPITSVSTTTIRIYTDSSTALFSKNGSTGWASAPFVLTVPPGATSVNFYYRDSTPGEHSIIASDDATQGVDFGLTNDVQTETATFGSASVLSVSAMSHSLQAGSSTPVAVMLKDSAGNVVSSPINQPVYMSVSGSAQVAPSPTGPWTSNSLGIVGVGQASITFYVKDIVAETFSVIASDSTPPDGTAGLVDGVDSVSVSAGQAVSLSFPTPAFQITAGAVSEAMSVGMVDQFGNPVSVTASTNVYLYADQTGGVFSVNPDFSSQRTSVTILAGQSSASFYFKQGIYGSGSVAISASDNAVAPDGAVGISDAVQTETVVPGAMYRFAVTNAQPISGIAGAVIPITITAENIYGTAIPFSNAISMYLRTTSVSSVHEFSASALSWVPISSLNAQVGASGVTLFYKDTGAGTPSVTIADEPVPGTDTGMLDASSQIVVSSAKADTLAFVSAPFSIQAGQVSPAMTLRLQDQYGNAVATTTATNIILSTTGSAGRFDATAIGSFTMTGITIPAGQTSTTLYYKDLSAGTPTIAASAPGFTPASEQEMVNWGAPSALQLSTSQATTTAGNISSPIAAMLVNSFGANIPAPAAFTISLSSSATTGMFDENLEGPFDGNITTVLIGQNATSTTFFYKDTKSGATVITATGSAVAAGSVSLAIVSDTAVRVGLLPASSEALEIGQKGATTTVSLYDQFDNVVTLGTSTEVSLAATSAQGVFIGSLGQVISRITILAGQSSASFSYKDLAVGSSTITAHAGNMLDATRVESVMYGAPAVIVLTASSTSLMAGEVSQVIVASLHNSSGQEIPAQGDTALSLSSGTFAGRFDLSSNGSFDGNISSVTILDGQSFGSFYYLDTQAGSLTITASRQGLSPGTLGMSVIAAAPSAISIINPVRVTRAGVASSAFTIEFLDNLGNVKTLISPVTVSLGTTATTGAFSSSPSGPWTISEVTVPAGASAASFYYRDTLIGTKTITILSTGLASSTQNTSITPGFMDRLAFVTDPQTITALQPSAVMMVQALDAFNNVTSSSSSMTLKLLSSSAQYQFSLSTTTWANVTSVALPANQSSAVFYYKDWKVGTSTITVRDATSKYGGATQSEKVISGAPAKFIITSAPQTVVTGTPSAAVRISLEDGAGDIVPSVSPVTATITGSSPTSVFTDDDTTGPWQSSFDILFAPGDVTKTFYFKDTVAGTLAVSINAPAFTADSQNETIIAGIPARIALVSASSTPAGQAMPVNVQVQTSDSLPISVQSTLIIPLSDSAGGEFSLTSSPWVPTASVAIGAGTYQKTVYFRSTVSGAHTITGDAASAGLGNAIASLQVLALNVYQLKILSGPAQAVVNQPSSAFVVQAQDQYGNIVSVNLVDTGGGDSVNVYLYGNGQFAATANGPWGIGSLPMTLGDSTFAFYYKGSIPGTEIITASDQSSNPVPDTGWTNGAWPFITLGETPTHVSFVTASQNVLPGTYALITIGAEKSDGTPAMLGTPLVVNLGATWIEGQFSLTNAATSSPISQVVIPVGQSTTHFYAYNTHAGTYELSLSSGALSGATQPFVVRNGVPAKLAFVSATQSVQAGSDSALMHIQVQDLFGNIATSSADMIVDLASADGGQFSLNAGGGWQTISNVTIPAGSSDAYFYVRNAALAGTYIISASDRSGPGLSTAMQDMTVTAGNVSRISIASPSIALIKGQTSSAITVTFLDQFGNMTSLSAPTTLYLYSSSVAGNFSADSLFGATTTSVSLPGGASSAVFYYRDRTSGSPIITVSDQTPLDSPDAGWQNASQTETITEGDPYQLRFIDAPTAVLAGDVRAFRVELENQYGEAVASVPGPLTAYLYSTSALGRFSLTTSFQPTDFVTNVRFDQGEMEKVFYYRDTSAGNPIITASDAIPLDSPDAGLINATRTQSILAGSVASLNFLNAPVSVEAGEASGALTVGLRDQFGNAVAASAPIDVYLYTDSVQGGFATSSTAAGFSLIQATIPAGANAVALYYKDLATGSPTLTISDASPLDVLDTGLANAVQMESINQGNIFRVAFITPAQSLEAGGVSDKMTVELENSHGIARFASSDTSLYLTTSNPQGRFALSPVGPWNLSSIVVRSGQASTDFYYRQLSQGNATLTVSDGTPANGPIGWIDATQAVGISAGTPTQISVSAPASVIAHHPSGLIVATLENAQGVASATTTPTRVYIRSSITDGTDEFAQSAQGPWGINYIDIPAGQTQALFYFRGISIGDRTIIVSDELPAVSGVGLANAQTDISVVPQTMDHLLVTNISDSQIQGQPSTVIVEPQDAGDYIYTDYSGTICFSASDADAVLPGCYTFDPLLDHGIHSFGNSIAFLSTGEKWVKAHDAVGGYSGQQSDITVIGNIGGPLAKVKFIDLPSVPVSVPRDRAFGPLTVELLDLNDQVVNAPADGYPVLITSNSPTALFSLSQSGPWTNQLIASVPRYLSSVNIYYKDSSSGNFTVLANDWSGGQNNPLVQDDSFAVHVSGLLIQASATLQSHDAGTTAFVTNPILFSNDSTHNDLNGQASLSVAVTDEATGAPVPSTLKFTLANPRGDMVRASTTPASNGTATFIEYPISAAIPADSGNWIETIVATDVVGRTATTTVNLPVSHWRAVLTYGVGYVQLGAPVPVSVQFMKDGVPTSLPAGYAFNLHWLYQQGTDVLGAPAITSADMTETFTGVYQGNLPTTALEAGVQYHGKLTLTNSGVIMGEDSHADIQIVNNPALAPKNFNVEKITTSVPPAPETYDLKFTWDQSPNATGYNLYRSQDKFTKLYDDPCTVAQVQNGDRTAGTCEKTIHMDTDPTDDATHWVLMANAPFGNVTTYTLRNAQTLPGDLYFFIIRADNGQVESGLSTMVVLNRQHLAFNSGGSTNFNRISVPYNLGFFTNPSPLSRSLITDASQLVVNIEGGTGLNTTSNISTIGIWDSVSQGITNTFQYKSGGAFKRWVGTAPISPSDSIYLQLSGNTSAFSWSLVGFDNFQARTYSLNSGGSTNFNWISMPYTGMYRTAFDIVRDIEGCTSIGCSQKITAIGMWGSANQGVTSVAQYKTGPLFNRWVGDFVLEPGTGLFLQLSPSATAFSWKPALVVEPY